MSASLREHALCCPCGTITASSPGPGEGRRLFRHVKGYHAAAAWCAHDGPGPDVTFLCAISGSLVFASRVLSMVCLWKLATLLDMGACGTEERPRIEQRYPVGAFVGRNTVIAFCSAMACNGRVTGLDHREMCQGKSTRFCRTESH